MKILAGLKARHGEPQRHYHSWAHIEALMAWLAQVRAQLHDPQAVELAILYHDAVYEPRSKENEARRCRTDARRADARRTVRSLPRRQDR